MLGMFYAAVVIAACNMATGIIQINIFLRYQSHGELPSQVQHPKEKRTLLLLPVL
jgi:hypothetical protein